MLAGARQHRHPVKKLDTAYAKVVAFLCNNYSTKKEAVREPAKKRRTRNVEAGKQP